MVLQGRSPKTKLLAGQRPSCRLWGEDFLCVVQLPGAPAFLGSRPPSIFKASSCICQSLSLSGFSFCRHIFSVSDPPVTLG